jgi:1-pyrroline-5-carboxylate dehydrogenase
MATRFTYTSGGLGSDVDDAFETHLAAARQAGPGSPLPHYIGGQQVTEGEVFQREDPAHSDEVASRAHEGGADGIERALAAARGAQERWRRMPYEERNRRLLAAADAIGERRSEIAAVVSLETGKTRSESLAEVQEGVELIEIYCRDMEQNGGFVKPLANFVDNESNTDVLKPYGVFGVISPFNFPFALTIGMTAAALVAGNTVVLKPSEEAPWSASLFIDVVEAAELPPGVLNLVHGGPATGQALVDSSVDGIAFTGSAEVGREIARKLQDGPYARPALTEMGGKNPAVVGASADVGKAAEGVARGAYGLSGQKCSACSRALVVADVYDEFVAKFAAFTEQLAIGDPSDRDAFLGPVVNAGSVERFDAAVASAKADGSIAAGGGRPDLPGYFVEPTVAADLPIGHPLTRNELFVPFVTVQRVGSLAEAIAEANAPVYGLAAGVFADDQREVDQFLDGIHAGVVYVNRRAGATTGAWPGTQTFCGWKSSGSTGKGGFGPHYLAQFMREQSQTVVL